MDKLQALGRVGPIERRGEEEPQRGHRKVDGRRQGMGSGQIQLEPSQVFERGRGRRSAEESGQLFNRPNVGFLRIGREMADVHVLDHPLAKRANASFGHGGSCLSGVANPTIFRQNPTASLRAFP
jgi:hypothetical protein